MLKLFYAPGTCALACHIALEEAGADYELVRLNLKEAEQRQPEYLKLNPKGRVPALATDRGVLSENPAILAFIAQTHPDAGLAPIGDPFAFAEVQAFNGFLSSSVHPTFAHRFRPERYADGDEHRQAVQAKVPEALGGYFALIEQQLADGRPWVHGEAYTISDGYLVVFTRWLEKNFHAVARDLPKTLAHRHRVEERPAVQRALEQES
jgi:glutathione S-transferase